MRSREAKRREAWKILVGIAAVVAGLLIVLAAVEASMEGQTVAAFLQAAILLGTAGIVWWYAKETQRLREAAQRQTQITQQIFEASYRPHATVKADEPADTSVHGRLSFHMVFENVGTVPAAITAWKVQGTLMDLDGREQPVERTEQIESPIGRCLAPHTAAMIMVHFTGGDLPNPTLPFRLYASVEYRGLGMSTYRTDFDAQRGGEGIWTAHGYTMT